MNEVHYKFYNRYIREYLYDPEKKTTLLSAIFPIIAAITIIYGIYPFFQQIKLNQDELNTKKTTLVKVGQTINKLEEFKEYYAKDKMYIDIIYKLLPIERSEANLVEELSLIAAKNNFALTNVTIDESFNSSSSETTTIDANLVETTAVVHITGNLIKLKELISDIENANRHIKIRQVRVTTASVNEGTIEMTLNFYRLNKI